MHILIIPSWYKTSSNPVLGSFFEEQARGLQSMGHKVGILHVGYKPFSYKDSLLNNVYNDEGIYTIQRDVKGIIPRNHQLNYFYLGVRAYQLFKEYVKEKGMPDIIHAHSVFWGGIASYYISRYTQIPYVITEHLTNFISGSVTHPTDIKFSKKVFNLSRRNIVVSYSFQKELAHFFKMSDDKFNVVHNMVSPEFFVDRKVTNLSGEAPVIFFTNSFMTPRKNHELLINAFFLFLKANPNAILYIGGDATSEPGLVYKNTLISLVKKLGLGNKVFFLGPLSRSEVKKQLDRCHVFLLASLYETFGVVLIEALAAGRPVISTNSKGPNDIINESNGLIVNDFTSESYFQAMLQIIANYSTYDQKSISDNCYKNYSAKTIMGQISSIYQSVLNQK